MSQIKLPDAYQRVEWIQSSGAQYIDTGYKPQTNARAEVSYMPISRNSGVELWIFAIWDDNAYWRCGFEGGGGASTSYGFTYSPNLELNKIIVGTGTLASSSRGGASSYSIYLFAQNEAGSVHHLNQGTQRLFNCKIWEGDDLKMNFIPCYRKSDDVIGLYDLVNDDFYTNAGTGEFTKGPDRVVNTVVNHGNVGTRKGTILPQPGTFYYNFKGGSLEGFKAAGGEDILTDGTYVIDENGLGQHSGANDRNTLAYVVVDLTTAKSISLSRVGTWIADSWSNGKCLGLSAGNKTDNRRRGNPNLLCQINLNTSSASTYSTNGVELLNSGGSSLVSDISRFAGTGGRTTQTVEVNLVTGVVNYRTTGADNHSFSITLNQEQIELVRTMTIAYFARGRGYSRYDSERMEEASIEIEY